MMAARPQNLQRLRHGVCLTGRNFNTFVETFNWIVDFCANLKGDADLNGRGGGGITLDRNDDSMPVIRLASLSNDNGGGEIVVDATPSCFYLIKVEQDDTTIWTINNCYVVNEGRIMLACSDSVIDRPGFFAIEFNLPFTYGSGEIRHYLNLEAVKFAQSDTSKYVILLYKFAQDSSGNLYPQIDFRNAPHMQLFG